MKLCTKIGANVNLRQVPIHFTAERNTDFVFKLRRFFSVICLNEVNKFLVTASYCRKKVPTKTIIEEIMCNYTIFVNVVLIL